MLYQIKYIVPQYKLSTVVCSGKLYFGPVHRGRSGTNWSDTMLTNWDFGPTPLPLSTLY